MSMLECKLREMRRCLSTWKPETGFTSASINFAMEDIIYGRRIASAIRRNGCCNSTDRIIDEIRLEARKDVRFATWFTHQKTAHIQSLCEFLIYRTPPHAAKAS